MKYSVTILMMLATIFLGSCKKEKSKAEVSSDSTRVVPVKVIDAIGGAVADGVNFSGTVEEEKNTAVSFSAAGTITELNIEEGQHVEKGQYIGRLDGVREVDAHQATQAALDQAQDAYNRVKMLYDNQAVPEIKLVEVRTKLEQAQSAAKLSQKAINDCKLYAPVSGVIYEKHAEMGQVVAPGAPIATIMCVGNLKINISVPESEISNIKVGQKASVVVAALNNRRFDAVVCEKGVKANALSRAYSVKFEVVGSQKDLMPGMIANVILQMADKNFSPGSVVIPANIIQLDDNNETFLWVAKDGKAHKVFVKCGDFSGEGVIVESGLRHGDKVIVEGQHKVSEGTPVKVE